MTSPAARRTVAIIPARFDSTRLPGKPLADIGGTPMIVRVMEQAARATLVHAVVVATDDQRIVDAVTAHGGKAVMTSAAISSGSDRIAVAARAMPDAEIIVNVQGDEPLIPPAMIDEAIAPLLRDPGINVGTLVRRIRSVAELQNPGIPKVTLDERGRCLYFSRSSIPYGRDCSPDELIAGWAVYRHIGLYVFRREFLLAFAAMAPTPLEQAEKLEQLRILEHGHAIHAVVTEYDSVAVDTPADLEHVRRLVKAKQD
jgi:3-deoxy-manno-octulosonate cytidylyltransferase (CMP-KDO synthetase)